MNPTRGQFGENESEFTHTGTKPFGPPPITQLTDTGLSRLWLQDLALKILYFQGYLTGYELAEKIALPYTSLVDKIVGAGLCIQHRRNHVAGQSLTAVTLGA